MSLSSFRISKGDAGLSFPEGFRLSFPARTNYMFALMRHAVPKLRAFTACLWLRPAAAGIGTPLSYAVAEQPNELVLLQDRSAPAELLIDDKVRNPHRAKKAQHLTEAGIGWNDDLEEKCHGLTLVRDFET